MLDGIDLEDKENVASVTSVIKAVLDGVKVAHDERVHSVCFFLMFFHGSEAACAIYSTTRNWLS